MIPPREPPEEVHPSLHLLSMIPINTKKNGGTCPCINYRALITISSLWQLHPPSLQRSPNACKIASDSLAKTFRETTIW